MDEISVFCIGMIVGILSSGFIIAITVPFEIDTQKARMLDSYICEDAGMGYAYGACYLLKEEITPDNRTIRVYQRYEISVKDRSVNLITKGGEIWSMKK